MLFSPQISKQEISMEKKKFTKMLSLKKKNIVDLTSNEMQNARGGNFDTPTINDGCDLPPPPTSIPCTVQNTWCVCGSGWCGYNHETDCIGPAITSP